MASTTDINTMLRRVTDRLGQIAFMRGQRAVLQVSRQLADALQLLRDSDAIVRLFITHYWAIYLHTGRKAMGPGSPATPGRKARFLVFFRVPRDDPRLPTPERRANVRRLTKDQFYYWMRQNKIAKKNGEPQPMIVVGWPDKPGKKVRGQKPRTFFANHRFGGMYGTLAQARQYIKPIVQSEMRGVIGEEYFKKKTERIRVRL